MNHPVSIAQLFWRTLIAFLVLTAVLYLALPWLVQPAAFAASLAVKGLAPGLLSQVEGTGRTLDFVTHLTLPVGAGRGVYVVSVSPGIYAYALPLFTALAIASRTRPSIGASVIIVLVLYASWTFSITFDFLNSVFAQIPITPLSELGLRRWHREAVAVGYQVGALLLPAIVPIATWLTVQPEWRKRLAH